MNWESVVSVANGCAESARLYGPHAICAYIFNAVRVGRTERVEGFDARFGTATAAVAYPWHLPSLQSRKTADIHPYEATPAWLVRAALDSITFEPGRFSFVDLGSGKGRVLLLASEFPFAKIVGVEIACELHVIAEDNIRRYKAVTTSDVVYELLCMDATEYEFGQEPLVLFLFNPFGRESMQKVLALLEASLRTTPRDAFVIYVNPRFERDILRSGNFRKVVGAGTWLRPWRRYAIYQANPVR